MHEDLVEPLCQEGRAAVLGFGLVGRMGLEELALCFQRCGDRFRSLDVALPTVHDGNVAKAEGDDTASEDIDNVGARIPTVMLATPRLIGT